MDKRVLLIEDEQFIREIYKRQLEKAGIATDDLASGKDVINTLKQRKYDLVLLDIMLPDTNGLEILRHMKQDDELKNIPAIFLTNLGQEELVKEGMTLGAIGYLIKASYDPNQIVDEVKNVLASGTLSTNPQPAQ